MGGDGGFGGGIRCRGCTGRRCWGIDLGGERLLKRRIGGLTLIICVYLLILQLLKALIFLIEMYMIE